MKDLDKRIRMVLEKLMGESDEMTMESDKEKITLALTRLSALYWEKDEEKFLEGLPAEHKKEAISLSTGGTQEYCYGCGMLLHQIIGKDIISCPFNACLAEIKAKLKHKGE